MTRGYLPTMRSYTLKQLEALFRRAIREDPSFREHAQEVLHPYNVVMELVDSHVSPRAVELTLSLSAPSHYHVEIPVSDAGRKLRVQVAQRPTVYIEVELDPEWCVDLGRASATLNNGIVNVELPRR